MTWLTGRSPILKRLTVTEQIVPVMISPIGIVELHRLSIELLQVKSYSDRSLVGEEDRRRDWDSHLVAGNKKAAQHYIKKARV